MRKTVIVASVMLVGSMAMPSMAHAKDAPKPPLFGGKSHIGKCKGHVVNPEVKGKDRDGDKSTDAPAKSDKGLNNKTLNSPGLNNKNIITGVIIHCR